MRYDAEHKSRTRARVVQEAIHSIVEFGPHRVGVAETMARAGLTVGGFYSHFKSKDDLLFTAVTEMVRESRSIFTSHTAGLPPEDAFRAYVQFYLSLEHRDSGRTGCALSVLMGDLPRLSAPVRQAFQDALSWLTAGLAKLLKQTGHPEAEMVASSTLSEMIGTVMLSRAVAPSALADQMLSRSLHSILQRADRPRGAEKKKGSRRAP